MKSRCGKSFFCLSFVGFALLLLTAGSCSAVEQLRARIIDESGQPINGGIFYVEAYTENGAFDFAFATSGQQGEIPPSGKPALTISWQAGAKLAIAAFAPGKKPIVVYDQLGRVKANGVEITLSGLPRQGERWEPRVAQLSYPFERNPELAARLATTSTVALREAFRAAYQPLLSGEEPVLSRREKEKIESLKRLEPTVR